MTQPRSTLAVLLALSMIVPAAGAFHLSAGAEDVIGLEKEEPPANTPDSVYERGTSNECADGDASQLSTATADGLCGVLRYNEGFPQYEAVSPPDQVSREGISIDLQMATYVGAYETHVCVLYCQSPETYRALHDVASEAGLTPDGETVGDEGYQAYGGNVYAISPMQAYESTGHRWLLPVTDTSFVAFVTDGQDRPVGQDRLESIVAAADRDDTLPDKAQAKVCAFSPLSHLGTHAKSAGVGCEVSLDWIGSGEDDPCKSPTYLCGNIQKAWRGTTMCPMWHAACYISDTWNSAHHFAPWHGVVAPSPPEGCGAAEPGFDTDASTFLAHDLDVYEPVTDETPATGVPFYWDALSENVPGLGPLRESRAPAVFETPVGQTIAEPLPFTEHSTEPNADPWLGINESSQTIVQERTLTDCQRLASGEEQADPWVNIVDGHVTRSVDRLGIPAGERPEPDHDPKPTMRITGHVGLFTDADDDGDYEQAPASSTLEDVEEFGAYPILWDHHEPGEGCQQTREGTTIGTVAHEAGYSDPTGLVVVLRMTAGTLVERDTGEAIAITSPRAAVLLSENLDMDDPEVQQIVDRAAGDRETFLLDEAAFAGQCDMPTGGFETPWEIQMEPMEGDGLVTAAVTTLAEPGPGGGAVPASPITLDAKTHVWYDVDPFQRSE